MWEAIGQVTSALTFIAFAVAAAAGVFRRKLLSHERQLLATPEVDRASLVQALNDSFIVPSLHVDPKSLTREQSYNLLLQQIRDRSRRFYMTAVLVGFLAFIGAGVAVYALSKVYGDNNNASFSLEESENKKDLPRQLDEKLQIGYANQSHPDLKPEPSLEARQIAIKLEGENLDLYSSVLQDLALGRFDEARAKTEASLRGGEIGLMQKYLAMGRLEVYTGHYEKGAQFLSKALALTGNDPWILGDLSRVRMYQGKYLEAKELCTKLIETEESNPLSSNEVLARGYSLLGEVSHAQGRYEEAKQHLATSYTHWERVAHPDSTLVARTINDLGQVYSELGYYEQALPLLEKALELRKRSRYRSVLGISETYNNIGLLKKRQRNYAEAHEFYAKAYQMLLVHFGELHPAVAMQANNLGSLYYEQERYEEAEQEHLRALKIWEYFLGPKHLDVARALNNIGTANQHLGRFDSAEKYFLRALSVFTNPELKDHPYHPIIISNMASLHAEQGRLDLARQEYRHALKMLKRSAPAGGDLMASFLNRLGKFCDAYGCEGDLREALKES